MSRPASKENSHSDVSSQQTISSNNPKKQGKQQQWCFQGSMCLASLPNKKYNPLKIRELAQHYSRQKELQQFRKSIKVRWQAASDEISKTLSQKSFRVRSMRVHPAMSYPCKEKRRINQYICIKRKNQTETYCERESDSREGGQEAEKQFIKYDGQPTQ